MVVSFHLRGVLLVGFGGSQPFSWGTVCKMPSFSKPFAPPFPPIVGTAVPAQLPLSFLGSPLPQLLRGLSDPKPHSYVISGSHSALGWLSWDLSFPWASWNSERLFALFHSSRVSHSFWIIRCTGGLFQNRFPEILEILSQQVWGEAKNRPG